MKFSKKTRRIAPHTSGFTLIEIMVASAIFIVVMTISLGSILSIVDGNKRILTLASVMNNLNLAVEDMSRTMRLGTTYHCGTGGTLNIPLDCPSGDTFIALEQAGGNSTTLGDQVVYKLIPHSRYPGDPDKFQLVKSVDGGNNFIPMTASEIVITNMKFYVIGSLPNDNMQPKVVIVLQGFSGDTIRTQSSFSIQTTVSQRIPDFNQ
ncbi:MAG: type II secretion system protein [Candidatus Paceibacterota bacterium]